MNALQPWGQSPHTPGPWLRAGLAAALVTAGALVTACSKGEPAPAATTATSSNAPPRASSSAQAARPRAAPPVREGGALVRGAGEEALYLAHEDLGVVRRIPLPIAGNKPIANVAMPGPPAAVLAMDGRVLVTIRGIKSGDQPMVAPGLLLVMKPDEVKGLVEEARVELPGDAWGVAVTPDEKTAVVTSAWAHQVSLVDLTTMKRRWTADVPREPRAVVVTRDGKSAYVTHLVRSTLTRIDGLDGDSPKARDVPFPSAPIRAIPERSDAAKLGYAAVMSPDGSRLFVPRQALGAVGREAWNGQATVDILLTADETPLAAPPKRFFIMETAAFMDETKELSGVLLREPFITGPGPIQAKQAFIQPRAVVYRRSTQTLLVASEGTDRLVELEALSMDPSTRALRTYEHICGAPTGIALSEDEGKAYVFCRSTHKLATLALDGYREGAPPPEKAAETLLAEDPLPPKAAAGRRFFYSANDSIMSDGYACAGCHPEGRDDGHVWHEDEQEDLSAKEKGKTEVWTRRMNAFFTNFGKMEDGQKGVPRQTPMLAGRVDAAGPYGWKGRSKTLKHRILAGFGIHRFWGGRGGGGPEGVERAEALIEFLRAGLMTPPREVRPLTAEEERGKKLFFDPVVACAECHTEKGGYTNRSMASFGEWIVDKANFVPEVEDWRFKTPSLLFVGGTPPYYHDGTSPTLEILLERNGDRMGRTKHLSKEDRAALAAFLKTL